MTNMRLMAVAAVFSFGQAFVSGAWAESKKDACDALVHARSDLYRMLIAKDRAALDDLNAKVQAASTALDSALAAMTGADAKVAADFKAVWDQFKVTRDKEIVPLLYKGDADEAKKIADGIQLERLSRMAGIMSCR